VIQEQTRLGFESLPIRVRYKLFSVCELRFRCLARRGKVLAKALARDPRSTSWRLKARVFGMGEPLQYLTDEHGQRMAVVLPISEYEKLLQDLEDLAVVAERRDEPLVPHAQFVSDLKRDGIL
jgi:hypothetical protein